MNYNLRDIENCIEDVYKKDMAYNWPDTCTLLRAYRDNLSELDAYMQSESFDDSINDFIESVIMYHTAPEELSVPEIFMLMFLTKPQQKKAVLKAYKNLKLKLKRDSNLESLVNDLEALHPIFLDFGKASTVRRVA